MPNGKAVKSRFADVHGVRRYVGRVLRALERDGNPAEPETARTMIYGAKVMAELINQDDLERRIKALEAKQGTVVFTASGTTTDATSEANTHDPAN